MNQQNQTISSRQLAFFAAFFLPLGKLLQLPSLLCEGAGGDLLIAATIGIGAEFIAFLSLFIFCAKTKESPLDFLEKRCGKLASSILYGVFALFLLVFATLPLFDLEKFSHAAFSDTSPTFFVFAPFFILSGFICTKGLTAYGRVFDLTPVLVLLPLLGLILMGAGQADFSRLLPLMEKPFRVSLKTLWQNASYFSSGGLLLPLLCCYRYEEGDGKKILPAFAVGGALTLLFLACFFSLFGLLGSKEHFAVMKIARYFPALKLIGRIDLLLVYSVSVALFYYTILPLRLFTECFQRCFSLKSRTILSAILSLALYFILLFFNKYTTKIHAFFSKNLSPVFLLFSLILPILFFVLSFTKVGGRCEVNTKFNRKNKTGEEP